MPGWIIFDRLNLIIFFCMDFFSGRLLLLYLSVNFVKCYLMGVNKIFLVHFVRHWLVEYQSDASNICFLFESFSSGSKFPSYWNIKTPYCQAFTMLSFFNGYFTTRLYAMLVELWVLTLQGLQFRRDCFLTFFRCHIRTLYIEMHNFIAICEN